MIYPVGSTFRVDEGFRVLPDLDDSVMNPFFPSGRYTLCVRFSTPADPYVIFRDAARQLFRMKEVFLEGVLQSHGMTVISAGDNPRYDLMIASQPEIMPAIKIDQSPEQLALTKEFGPFISFQEVGSEKILYGYVQGGIPTCLMTRTKNLPRQISYQLITEDDRRKPSENGFAFVRTNVGFDEVPPDIRAQFSKQEAAFKGTEESRSESVTSSSSSSSSSATQQGEPSAPGGASNAREESTNSN